jgi:hypothetical protein
VLNELLRPAGALRPASAVQLDVAQAPAAPAPTALGAGSAGLIDAPALAPCPTPLTVHVPGAPWPVAFARAPSAAELLGALASKLQKPLAEDALRALPREAQARAQAAYAARVAAMPGVLPGLRRFDVLGGRTRFGGMLVRKDGSLEAMFVE